MSRDINLQIAKQLLIALAENMDSGEIAKMFSDDVKFEIAGDVGALPWIGQKTGRQAVIGFIDNTRRLIEQVRFAVQDILASDDRAVIVGELTTRINATGRIIESAFAIVLTLSGGEIVGFRMLEDSFAVSKAARS